MMWYVHSLFSCSSTVVLCIVLLVHKQWGDNDGLVILLFRIYKKLNHAGKENMIEYETVLV